MFKRLLMLMVISFALVGCGDSGKTLDFTSEQTIKSSAEQMVNTLPNDNDKALFQKALSFAVFSAFMETKGDEKASMELLKKKLGGKTAEAIIKEFGDGKQ